MVNYVSIIIVNISTTIIITIYTYNQGKHSEAEVLYKQCLDKQKVVLGENHLETIGTMSNLAGTYGSQGKYSDAEVIFKQCYDKMKSALGVNHPDTLMAMHNLANNYSRQGIKS